MKKQTSWFYLCLVALVWLGLHLGNASDMAAAVSAAPATVMAAEGCSAGIGNITIQRSSGGNNFVVSWEAPSPCLNGFEVSLTVIKLSGAERTDTKKINSRTLIATFSFAGDGDLNPIKKARATVKGTGLMAAKGTLTKSLAIGSGTGSSAPTPVPTFFLRGQILNTQTGTPLVGVKLEFDIVDVLFGRPAVETNSQGRWVQEGFPVGKQVRITASKRFFVIEPATRTVSEGGVVQFSGRPNEIGGTSPPPAAATFSATGQAKVDDLAQGTQIPLGGATITFSVQNANGTKPNIPGPVTTQGKGNWNQSGFTVGVIYKATISKSGITFSNSTALFTGSSPGQVVSDVGFLGTVGSPPPAPTKPFAVSGQVNVNSQSIQITSPLSGATITFKLKNPSAAGAVNVPGPVTSKSNGSWSQSGFTSGVQYIATCTSTNVVFSDVREINGPSQGVNFLGKTK